VPAGLVNPNVTEGFSNLQVSNIPNNLPGMGAYPLAIWGWGYPASLVVVILHVFTHVGRHVSRITPWTIIVTLCGPYVGPLATTFCAAVEVSKEHEALLVAKEDQTSEVEGASGGGLPCARNHGPRTYSVKLFAE
jgi:hypothetical protein